MKLEGIGSVNTTVGQGSATTSNTKANAVESIDISTVNMVQTTSINNTTDENNKSGRVEGQASNEQIKEALEKFNKEAISHSEAIFGIHEETNRVTIKIVNKETKEVLKEFPAEKTLEWIARALENAGILVDERR